MSSTKKIISDEVLFRISGGFPDTANPVDERDIWKSLEQLINTKFRLRQFEEVLLNGETIPQNLNIAIYENVAVTSHGTLKSKAILPVMPISLPKGMGIFMIYDPAYPDKPFIPLSRGMGAMLQTDKLLGDLMGLVAFEPRGNQVIFNRNLFILGVTNVTMELVVFDMSLYGKNDILPITSDMEAELVDELVKQFVWVNPENGLVNNFNTINQTQKQ